MEYTIAQNLYSRLSMIFDNSLVVLTFSQLVPDWTGWTCGSSYLTMKTLLLCLTLQKI